MKEGSLKVSLEVLIFWKKEERKDGSFFFYKNIRNMRVIYLYINELFRKQRPYSSADIFSRLITVRQGSESVWLTDLAAFTAAAVMREMLAAALDAATRILLLTWPSTTSNSHTAVTACTHTSDTPALHAARLYLGFEHVSKSGFLL